MLVAGRAERLDMGPFRAQVLDVAIADGTVWAATDLGLWRRTEDGWRSAGERDEPMTRVVADPGWEGGLWVRTASGVARTDDGGTSWRDLGGGPRVQNDLAWGGPAPGGALLVTSPSGTWDWREEGWTRLDPTPGRSVSWWDGRPIVATGDRLLGRSADAELISAGPPPWVPLGQLLHTALSRRELTQSMSARRWVRTLLPEVTLDGTYRERSERELDLYTTAGTHGELTLKVQLRWIPAGRTTSMVSEAAEDLSLRLPEFADRVFDGLLDAGEAADREATEYRGELTRDIVALYRARNTLWLERAAVPPDSLLAEVRWQLRLDDIEARLDALTDGAVSAWDENVE